MTIYYFLFEVLPTEQNPENEYCTGAFVNTWVKASDASSALSKAKEYIQLKGWVILTVEEEFIATREQYKNDEGLTKALECFDKAESDGIAAIFYTWADDGVQ